MILSSRIFQLAQLLVLIDAGTILPDACSPVKIVCVGEGDSCLYDQNDLKSNSGYCTGARFSVCRVCGQEDLTCHAGYCMKNIGTKNERCGMQNYHVACKKGLTCVGSYCKEPTPSADEKLLGRGEKCDPYDDQCISTLMCDINQKCSAPVCKDGNDRCSLDVELFPPGSVDESDCEDQGCDWVGTDSDFIMDDSTRVNTCVTSNDCHFGQYCNDDMCLDSILIGRRLNAACVSADATGNDQCGYGMKCVQKYPYEVHSNHQALVCKWNVGPFEKSVGMRCSGNSDCGKGMNCWNSVCSKPYTTHNGEGCDSSSECGRGMYCSCPEHGDSSGGRKRCMVSSSYQTHDKDVDDFNGIYRPLVNCVNNNKCKLLRCILAHCRDLYEKWQNRNDRSMICMAKTGDDAYVKQAAYEGVPSGRSNSKISALLQKATDWETAAVFFIVITIICALVGFYVFKNKSADGGTTSAT